MFGETGAVYAFLRISRAIAALASRLFHLIIVEFFDDFSQIEPTASSDSAQITMEGNGLGSYILWKEHLAFRKPGSKVGTWSRLPFPNSFCTIVPFQFPRIPGNRLKVCACGSSIIVQFARNLD
jgi:hypothetical protein